MKKVIIVLLLLIPLIVLFTISATGMILSAEVVIEIESFDLWHANERVTQVTINYSEYHDNGLTYQLTPHYYPALAQISGFRWYSDNQEVATVSDGVVTFHECGVAKITAESLDAVSVRSSCSFCVEDDVIHKLEVSFFDGEKTEELQMAVYETRQIRTEITPYKALSGDPIYQSSNESVFTCDRSGILTAKGSGRATLTISVTDKKGNTVRKELPVSVSGETLVKQTTVYAYGTAVDLSTYLSAGTVEGGAIANLREITPGGRKTYQVNGNGRSEIITVVRLSAERTIGIRGYDTLLAGDWKDGAYLPVGRSLALTPIDLLTSEELEGVEIHSDNSDVLEVRGNVVWALSSGTVFLTIRKEGYESFSLSVVCTVPIIHFSLNVDADEDDVGLGSKRVYGTMSIYDGQVEKGIRILPRSVYPANADPTFLYFVEGEDATIDQTGRLVFKDSAVGKKVTVTVRCLYSNKSLSRSYTFENIVKGINVGLEYGANPYDEETGVMPSFEPYYDALTTMEADRDIALVFQTNIYMPQRKTVEAISGRKYKKIAFIRDIYGNGYKLDGQFYQYAFSSALFEDADDKLVEGFPDQKEVEIRDLFINSSAPVGKEASVNFSELMQKGGVPLRTSFVKRKDYEIRFRYCVFQYAYSHFTGSGGTVSFDGCIFRNSAGAAFILGSKENQENYVSFNNCIFSHSLSMAGMVANGTIGDKKAPVYYNALRWTGSNYIYNWKKSEEVRLDFIPLGAVGGDVQSLLGYINEKINECARNSVLGNQNEELKYRKGNDIYVNIGVLLVDYWKPLPFILNEERAKPTDGFLLEINEEEASILSFKMNLVAIGGDTIVRLASGAMDLGHSNTLLTNKRKDGTFNTEPGETYKLDQKTFKRLRGEVA